MKHIYLILLLLPISIFAQTYFRMGYDISYDAVGTIPSRDMPFLKANWDTVTYFTGGMTDPVGGIKHLTKIKAAGASETVLFMDNGNPLDIDLEHYPYMTIRIQSTANKDVQMAFGFKDGAGKTFTVKGGGVWQVIRLDFADQPPMKGTFNNINWFWTEPVGTTFPYDINIDYIRLGGLDNKGNGATLQTGDPDSTIKVSMSPIADQQCEKEGGQQTINLTGITNGTNVDLLSFSQTNSRPSLFESITFGTIQSDGTCAMIYTPKTGQVGLSNVHLLLTYNRGDSVIKYKSLWFNIKVITDPVIKTLPVALTAQMNQAKVSSKLQGIYNSVGTSNKLLLEANVNNNELTTNLKVDTVKSDGTATLSFIPGTDKCGSDTITLTLTDIITTRSVKYQIPVSVSGCPGTIDAMEDHKLDLKIYPNPATDKVILTLSENEGCKVTFIDITGRNVMSQFIPAGQIESDLNLSMLNQGVYFVIVEMKGEKIARKIIIK